MDIQNILYNLTIIYVCTQVWSFGRNKQTSSFVNYCGSVFNFIHEDETWEVTRVQYKMIIILCRPEIDTVFGISCIVSSVFQFISKIYFWVFCESTDTISRENVSHFASLYASRCIDEVSPVVYLRYELHNFCAAGARDKNQ